MLAVPGSGVGEGDSVGVFLCCQTSKPSQHQTEKLRSYPCATVILRLHYVPDGHVSDNRYQNMG